MAAAKSLQNNDGKTVYVLSDSSGESALRAILSVLELHPKSKVGEPLIYPTIQTMEEIEAAVLEAAEHGGLILYTFADDSHCSFLEYLAERHRVAAVDLFEKLKPAVSAWLHSEPKREPSHAEDLRKRLLIDKARHFYEKTEDGRRPECLVDAEFVLIGLSRVTKSPTGWDLANRGRLVANVPLVLEVPPPKELSLVDPERVFILTMKSPKDLQERRLKRIEFLGIGPDDAYVDIRNIRREFAMVQDLISKNPPWQVIDVTTRQPEETSAQIRHLWQAASASRK